MCFVEIPDVTSFVILAIRYCCCNPCLGKTLKRYEFWNLLRLYYRLVYSIGDDNLITLRVEIARQVFAIRTICGLFVSVSQLLLIIYLNQDGVIKDNNGLFITLMVFLSLHLVYTFSTTVILYATNVFKIETFHILLILIFKLVSLSISGCYIVLSYNLSVCRIWDCATFDLRENGVTEQNEFIFIFLIYSIGDFILDGLEFIRHCKYFWTRRRNPGPCFACILRQ